jgi:hypothetical protein
MKKLITLLLLFTLVGFLSANQVVITNDYEYIVSTGKTYNFNNGNPSNNVKYDRTNKIQIQNNKVIANPLSYHYAFFWTEADAFIGYYKTNKGITTSGAYLGQVNTQSIPLPLNAYSFALVRYDNDYEVINGITIEDIFIDSDNYFDNDIEWNALNNQSNNDVFVSNQVIVNGDFSNGTTSWNNANSSTLSVIDGDLFITGNGISNIPRTDKFSQLVIGNVYYFATKMMVSNSVAVSISFVDFNGIGVTQNSPVINQTYSLTAKITAANAGISVRHTYANAATALNKVLKVDYVFAFNLTSLGLTSLTKTNLDNFFNLYQNINNNNFIYTGYSTDFINPTFAFDTKLLNLTDIFGAGNEPNQATIEQYYDDYLEYLDYLYVCCNIFATQTISFETIYFDDGVSTEIERLGSILIFTLIGFTLMIFGFASRRRIFNLLSIGAFVVLGFLLIEFVGFIVILFGLIFINVYYTFFGEL